MTESPLAALLWPWWRVQTRSSGAVGLPEGPPAAAGLGEELPALSPDPSPALPRSLSSWGSALAPWIPSDDADPTAGDSLSRLLISGVAGPGRVPAAARQMFLVGADGALQPQDGSGFSGLREGLARALGLSGEPLCSCALCQGMAVGARRELIERFGGRPSGADRDPAVAAPRSLPASPQAAGAGGVAAAPLAAATPVALALAIADQDVFRLEMNPGASKTIYLNFLGASLSGTKWIPSGSTWNGVAPAFTLDSDTSTNFSAAELAAIKEIFARVACDYAPFNVNVTTKAPTSDRINRSSSSDTIYGTICLFSNISSQTGYANAGGVAYVGVFDSVNAEAYKPALVFPNKLGNSAKNIAEAASHEIGHNLNLRHDGTSASGYYEGQGSSPGWAPIMGVGYYRTLTQFSRGAYNDANNTENDFSLITGEGVGYWQDFVGNDRATAQALTLTDADGDGRSDMLRLGGSIELTSGDGLGIPDQDYYSFLAPSNGSVTINVRNALYYFDPAAARYTFAPVPTGFGNLRLDARLQDANGFVLADWSNNASLDVANFSVSGLTGGQNYYLSVLANTVSPDGEDTYGSLGDYVLDLVYQGQPVGPPSPSPTASLSAPASVREGEAFTIDMTTTGLADGSPLTWRLSGSGVTAADVVPAALTGSVVVKGGAASLTLSLAADTLIEPTESALFELLNGSNVLASRSLSLLDTIRIWGTTGSDRITGADNRFERISGVLSSGTTASALGTGQVDVVTGGIGPDEFLLSEVRSGSLRVFYNDNVNSRTGTGDYLQINDFNPGVDKLRFASASSSRYFSRNNGSSTWIWFDRNGNGSLNTTNGQSSSDELIAVLSGVSLGNATISGTSIPSWAVFG